MMGKVAVALRFWNSRGSGFWGRLALKCRYCGEVSGRRKWRLKRRPRQDVVRLHSDYYCASGCLETALSEILRTRLAERRSRAGHRVPLGLLLLSRQQLTVEQLRIALQAQEAAARSGNSTEQNPGGDPNPGRKKIGLWLQELGFATEEQVTAALARQWSCPVLRTGLMTAASRRFPAIPAKLLENFRMMPAELVEATGTLLMAFSEDINYPVLYAIEQMLGYHTEPCLVRPSTMEKSLQALGRQPRSKDVFFDGLQTTDECARIIANYAVKLRAEEVRVAGCGDHSWVRLERAQQNSVTLLLRISSQLPYPHKTMQDQCPSDAARRPLRSDIDPSWQPGSE